MNCIVMTTLGVKKRRSPKCWEFRASKDRLFIDCEGGYPMSWTNQGDMYLDEMFMSRVPQSSAEHTEILHLDGDPLNCTQSNMRWVTREEFIAWNSSPKTPPSESFRRIDDEDELDDDDGEEVTVH